MTTFGAYLKQLRKSVNMTLLQVAEATGVSNPYLSQLETGARHKVTPAILRKLAPVYQVTEKHLLEKAGYLTDEDNLDYNSLELQRAYDFARTDKCFKHGISIVGEVDETVKRFVVELYEAATGRKLILGGTENEKPNNIDQTVQGVDGTE